MSEAKTELHPFEKAGLGIAPFRFIGMARKVGPIRTELGNGITLESGSPGQPMGTCRYCGQGIAYCYEIKSADGKTFEVGSDCVNKLSRESNEKRDPVIAAINRKAREVKNQVRHAREKKKQIEAQALFEANHTRFEKMPHPNKYFADQGKTMLDYFKYVGVRHSDLKWLRHICESSLGKGA